MIEGKFLVYGSIGSGKTTLSRQIFSNLPIIELDEINRNLIEPGNLGYIQLKENLSSEFFNVNNQLNKKKLKINLFHDEKLRQKVENILHPLIFNELETFTSQKEEFVVISPLIKMLSKKIQFNLKIKVVCNINEQIKRVELRDALDTKLIKKIIISQEKNYESIKPDFVFDSLGDLNEQIIKLNKIL